MKKYILFALIFPFITAQASQSLPNDINTFSTNLYKQLSSESLQAGKNIFMSPYSISTAMAMTYAGARAKTAEEMAKSLNFNISQQELPKSFKNLANILRKSGKESKCQLDIANGLVLTKHGSMLKPEFIKQIKNAYEAELFTALDVTPINKWVENKTAGKIKKMLSQLNPNSVCVLLNAIYFKGKWENQFDTKNTNDAPFFVNGKEPLKTPFMYRSGEYRYIDENSLSIIELPYSGKKLSMIVFLPKDKSGLSMLEKSLSQHATDEWLGKLSNTYPKQVHVYLPKFKMDSEYDLIPTFKSLGLLSAFELSNADFTGMGGTPGDIAIGQIKHKAFVEVNEEGTEAAAATAVEMITKSAMIPEEIIKFRADHPFMFMIKDNDSGTVLFMGRVISPK